MLGFTEDSAVEQPVIETLVRAGWTHIPGPELDRSTNDVLNERSLRDALIRLNPSIARRPERADEVIYKLRSVLIGASAAGLVSANEQFMKWVRGEFSLPIGLNDEHETVRIIDFKNIQLLFQLLNFLNEIVLCFICPSSHGLIP